MGVVDHEQGVEALFEADQLRQRREVAIHAEHPVGDDQPASPAAGRFGVHQRLEAGDAAMGIDDGARLAEPATVDD